MESVESQIAEWRAYVASAPGINGHDVDELEDHLRHQIAELNAAGLTADEGFLIAVKRLGDVDGLSREFAREHSGRLWKQLLVGGDEEPARRPTGWFETLAFAVAAAVVIQVARLAAHAPEEEPTWLVRNSSLFVLPFLAGYFARRRQLDTRRWVLTASPFVVASAVANRRAPKRRRRRWTVGNTLSGLRAPNARMATYRPSTSRRCRTRESSRRAPERLGDAHGQSHFGSRTWRLREAGATGSACSGGAAASCHVAPRAVRSGVARRYARLLRVPTQSMLLVCGREVGRPTSQAVA